MRIQLSTDQESLKEAKIIAIPVFINESPKFENQLIKDFLKDNPKFGAPNEIQLLFNAEQSFLLVGVGEKDKFDFETCQNFGGTVSKYLIDRFKDATLIPPESDKLASDVVVYALVLGAEIAFHDPSTRFKTGKEPTKLGGLQIFLEKARGEDKIAIKKASVVSLGINMARLHGDLPPNEATPAYFVETAKKIAHDFKLKITVIDEKMAQKKGMGAFAAVAKGSDEPSFVVALEYTGNARSKDKYGLIGKGLTFDSGGISIKPSSGMHEMKYDMCGAANVLGLMQIIGELKPRVNVSAVLALTENLPSGKALKPGDIIKSYSGKTVETINTDAEGRLVLMDALTYAQKDLNATKLIDLATLTGAMVVALGDKITGVFTNNKEFSEKLVKLGETVGEKFWQMPLGEEYKDMIKSDIADITNIGHGGSSPSTAGSITAAKFIETVVEETTPWIHLDIAGTAWDLKPTPYSAPGATGVGIKTLVELILQ
ncbi:MAG: leucyl aminopeptidase [Candidatus Daviesbacteria bacterium]|nr:leucyl aminopeptidase [Candidatus Daviesbacteria bacterium]